MFLWTLEEAMENQNLQQIRDFADKAHGDQMRKYTPERYIVHPVRVMHTCAEYTRRLPVLAAALLHDVLEDTDTGAQEIMEFLTPLIGSEQARQTLHLVQELTDEYEKEKYPQWNRKKRKEMESRRLGKTSAEAQTIKYADILDNSREIMEHEPGFGIKFSKECLMSLEKMTKGNPELRGRALEAIQTNLRKGR